MTDDHGRFLFPPCDSIKPPHEFQAFRIAPESGDIIGVKDMGEKGDGSSPTLLQWNNFDNPLRMMLFRCAPAISMIILGFRCVSSNEVMGFQ